MTKRPMYLQHVNVYVRNVASGLGPRGPGREQVVVGDRVAAAAPRP